jgi:hypothetical protein
VVPGMTPNLLHQLWKLIENSQAGFLLLDDQSLVQGLTQKLREHQALSREEEAEAKAYIQSRLLLIREAG